MEKKKETVLITGATGSVGSAMAEVFVKSNTRVILAVRNIKKGDEFKQRLSKKYPISDIVVTKMDMTDLKEVRSSIKSILNSGKIDMLIHSVATFSSGKIIMSNGFEEMFSINWAAEVLKELVASPDAFTVNGAYYKMQKKQNVRPYLYSNEIQSKLWDRTQELIK